MTTLHISQLPFNKKTYILIVIFFKRRPKVYVKIDLCYGFDEGKMNIGEHLSKQSRDKYSMFSLPSAKHSFVFWFVTKWSKIILFILVQFVVSV